MKRGEFVMATYMMLFRLPEKAWSTSRKVQNGSQEIKKAFATAGVEVRDFYMLMGRYDTAFLIDAPDDETAVSSALAVSSLGYVRTETLRAFNEGEFRKIIAGMR
jgi:uncharacterized protein with GYD domain